MNFRGVISEDLFRRVSFKVMKHVVTSGSPFVSCGGEKILEELGLDERHVHCVMMMHRDIVPRAFSCNYPDFVALILKLLNGSPLGKSRDRATEEEYCLSGADVSTIGDYGTCLVGEMDGLGQGWQKGYGWEAKSFLWVTLCLKGVALLGVWAERATTTGASAGWEVNTMVCGSSKSGEGEGEARVIVMSTVRLGTLLFLHTKAFFWTLKEKQSHSHSVKKLLRVRELAYKWINGGTRPNSMISDLCNDGVWSLPLPRSEDQLALHAYLTTVTLTDSEDTVSLSSPKHLRLLSLLAWQAAIYTLWTERNSRIHKNEFRSTSTIALIKNRISSFRYSSPALSSAMMQIWLHD
ncbi:hypothetical protein F2Q70_00044234 [Brassica cretica]|uniref:Uncharacterized protein n=1 Tax=Brassica cretica TaxID=69181 RepID=A0A8S9KDK6_BRACR|nr:hypothetical protein F2Q70_00044234 [Brassica cretica]